jgi:hypothetical protein
MVFDRTKTRARIENINHARVESQNSGQLRSRCLEKSRFNLMFWRGRSALRPYEKPCSCRGDPAREVRPGIKKRTLCSPTKRGPIHANFQGNPNFALTVTYDSKPTTQNCTLTCLVLTYSRMPRRPNSTPKPEFFQPSYGA